MTISYVVSFENAREIATCYDLVGEWAHALELKPLVDPMTKQPQFLTQERREAVFCQIEAIRRRVYGRRAELRISKTLEFVLRAEAPTDLRQPKEYDFCPVSFLREIVSPTGVSCCPYYRTDARFRTGDLRDAIAPEWLQSHARAKTLGTVNPRRDCQFVCNCHRARQNRPLMGALEPASCVGDDIPHFVGFSQACFFVGAAGFVAVRSFMR